MKQILAAFLLFTCVLAQAADRPEVSRYVKAFSGEEGIKVYVARIGAIDKGEVLLQITGIDSVEDGLIQKAHVEQRNQGMQRRYTIKRNGQDVAVLILEHNSGTVYLPAQPNSLSESSVKYDEGLSLQSNAEHMLTQWQEQGSK